MKVTTTATKKDRRPTSNDLHAERIIALSTNPLARNLLVATMKKGRLSEAKIQKALESTGFQGYVLKALNTPGSYSPSTPTS